MQNQDMSLLKEILLTPSSQLITDRFSAAAENASCTGTCRSGTCYYPIAPLV